MVRLFNKMDKTLLFLTIFMFLFGLFMILDASSMRSLLDYGTNNKFFYKQLFTLILSTVLSIFIIIIPIKKYKRFNNLIAFILIFMLLFLLLKGETTNNAKQWIYILGFGLQPSEFAKISVMMCMGCYYKEKVKELNDIKKVLVPIGLGAVYTLLTLLQPDGGTGLIICLIVVMIFFAVPFTKKIKMNVIGIGLALLTTALLILLISGHNILTGTQASRFNYLKPCTRYQESTGYQVCNGYIAINNGKLFSIDPGNSKQKYLYLPEAYTDFIFPIIVEEMGLITGIILILIYMIIIFRCLKIARNSPDLMNAIIAYGTASYIFLHVVINLNGVLGILPLTGVPLPFLSYGGSFALSLSIALALVQRVQIENYDYRKKMVLK